MNNTGFKFKDIERILLRNGFEFVSQRGSHRKYARNHQYLVVHAKEVNRMIWRRLCKEFNINTDI